MNEQMLFEALNGADDAALDRAFAADGKGSGRRTKKMPKVALVAAALIALFSLSAAAAYRFFIPKGLEEELQLASPRITTVIDTGRADENSVRIENKTAESAGYGVTFEAIVRGDSLRETFIDGVDEREIIGSERTYAIFSITRLDGGRVLDLKKPTRGDFGFVASMKGYAPNPGMFLAESTRYDDGAVLYLACDVTRCLIFADRELYISVIGRHVTTQQILRMDANGEPAFVESWNGLGVTFPLKLDPASADAAAQVKYMEENPCFISEPDYAWSDYMLEEGERSKASGVEDYIGDNVWENDFRLRAGEIEYLEAYLERRDRWKDPDVRLLTLEELDSVVMPALEAVAERIRSGELDPDLEQKWLAEGKVDPSLFPAEASTFPLPDGSVCYFMDWNFFVRLHTDGHLSFLRTECERIPVETFDLGNYWNAYHLCRGVPEQNGLNGAQMVAYYVDGRDPRELPRGEMDEATALGIYERDCAFDSFEDAVYTYLLNYAYDDGVFTVLPAR